MNSISLKYQNFCVDVDQRESTTAEEEKTIGTLPYTHGKILSQSKVGDYGGNSKLANQKVGGKISANQI